MIHHISTASLCNTDILSIARSIEDELTCVLNVVRTQQPETRWRIGIEDFMRSYVSGKFHTKGVIQLAQLNGMVSYGCWLLFNVRAAHYHPTLVRSYLGIPSQVKGKVKQTVLEHVARMEPMMSQHWVYTNKGTLHDVSYDLADAYVVAFFTFMQHIKDDLLTNATLYQCFHANYIGILSQKLKSKEAQNVMRMDSQEQMSYTRDCYAVAIEKWMRSHFNGLYSAVCRKTK